MCIRDSLDGSHQRVAVEVLRYGPLSRSVLVRRLGLSAGSLTRLTRPLVASGLLVEGDPAERNRSGRPSLPLDVRAGSRLFAGLKLTGDELYAVVTDLRARVLAETARPLERTDPDSVVAHAASVLAELGDRHPGIVRLGVGLGAQVVDGRHVAVAPFLGWDDVPLADLLTRATGLPTVVDNDVRALTAAEHWFGEGRGMHSFALITIGAGVGAGIVVHDRVVDGAHGVGGSIGHHRIGSTGLCEHGHHGCAQALLSSGAVAGSVSQALGRPVDLTGVLDLARDGNPAAVRVVTDAGCGLGALIADVAGFVDPEAIILSGDGVALADAARAEMDRTLRRLRPPEAPVPRVLRRPFTFAEWARGAAAVAIQAHVLGRA